MASSTPTTKFKIALCQLVVVLDKKKNIAHAREAIEDAANKGAKLVVLPEMWNCPYSHDNFSIFAEDFDEKDASPSFTMLSEAASSQGITIVGGSVPERCGDQFFNACCVFGTDGKLIAKYRKLHLLEINIPGEVFFKESDTFTAGDAATIVDTDVGRIGIGICHDLRFPELAMLYKARGAQILCYPGAFSEHSGKMLWELVQRARAADNQFFVATCSSARSPTSGFYSVWGHSTVVGPLGEIIATTGHEETTVITEIDYSKMQLPRESNPIGKQKRGMSTSLLTSMNRNRMSSDPRQPTEYQGPRHLLNLFQSASNGCEQRSDCRSVLHPMNPNKVNEVSKLN